MWQAHFSRLEWSLPWVEPQSWEKRSGPRVVLGSLICVMTVHPFRTRLPTRCRCQAPHMDTSKTGIILDLRLRINVETEWKRFVAEPSWHPMYVRVDHQTLVTALSLASQQQHSKKFSDMCEPDIPSLWKRTPASGKNNDTPPCKKTKYPPTPMGSLGLHSSYEFSCSTEQLNWHRKTGDSHVSWRVEAVASWTYNPKLCPSRNLPWIGWIHSDRYWLSLWDSVTSKPVQ